jgi:hypothetical protein
MLVSTSSKIFYMIVFVSSHWRVAANLELPGAARQVRQKAAPYFRITQLYNFNITAREYFSPVRQELSAIQSLDFYAK